MENMERGKRKLKSKYQKEEHVRKDKERRE